jgi:hypothetical protein
MVAMIIQIRGTSGSGKSTAMREIMKALSRDREWRPFFADGRRNPLGYELQRGTTFYQVLGHYESPCGGCDTIGSARQVFELIERRQRNLQLCDFVLCEGLLLSEDVKWTSQLQDVRVYFLTTPLPTCLDRIRQRRAARGNEKPLDPENTTQRVNSIESARRRLSEGGIYCRRANFDQTVVAVLKQIKRN